MTLAPGLAHKYTRTVVADSGKAYYNYGRKKFYSTGPCSGNICFSSLDASVNVGRIRRYRHYRLTGVDVIKLC